MARNEGAGGGEQAQGAGRVSLRPLAAGDQDEFMALARRLAGPRAVGDHP
jgi:hypothetical protein